MSQNNQFTTPTITDLPKLYKGYYLIDRAGAGGMAEVFRAVTQDSIGRHVIIKRCHQHLIHAQGFTHMFLDEIKVSSLLNHPNIVRVNTYAQDGSFIDLEFVNGLNLLQILKFAKENKIFFPLDLGLYIALQVASGLAYAHQLKDPVTGESYGIIHRDVSPQNIMVSFDGHVKILDFGIAKIKDQLDLTEVGVIKGKLNYMAPEQVHTVKHLDNRVDVFSLGIVLWEVLTQKKLITATSSKKLIEELKLWDTSQLSQELEGMDPGLINICKKALQNDPRDRYQSMDEMQRDILKFLKNCQIADLTKKMKEWMAQHFGNEIQRSTDILREAMIKIKQIDRDVDKTEVISAAPPNSATQSREFKRPKRFILAISVMTIAVVAVGVYLTLPYLREDTQGLISHNASTGQVANVQVEPTRQITSTTLNEPQDEMKTHLGAVRYQLKDIKKLINDKMWVEFLSHASDVVPSERTKEWEAIVAHGTLEHLSSLNAQDTPEATFQTLREYSERFPFLQSDVNFVKERSKVGLIFYNQCLADKKRQDCRNLFLDFVKKSPLDSNTAFEAGRITTRYLFHRAAIPFFLFAIENSREISYCQDERLISAAQNALTLSEGQEFDATLRLASQYCYQQLKPHLISSLSAKNKGLEREPLCKILKAKGGLTKIAEARCRN